jgi:uncharacterized coiled-coil protein SlyX
MSPLEEMLHATLLEKERLIAEKDRLIAELDERMRTQQTTIEKMQHQMEDLLRRLYGRKSEKLDPNQLLLEELILRIHNT